MSVIRDLKRGDTLIEVMLAFSIFSAIVVGAFVIMNQGISSTQNALEINLVRNQIDTQAELLRHLNNGKLTSVGRASNEQAIQWDKAVDNTYIANAAQKYDSINTVEDCKPDSLPPHAFFINPMTGEVIRGVDNFEAPATFSQVQEVSPGVMKSSMLWVQAVKGQDDSLNQTSYYDFHIRACWEAPGAGAGLLKLGTIVRLYVPKN